MAKLKTVDRNVSLGNLETGFRDFLIGKIGNSHRFLSRKMLDYPQEFYVKY